MALKSKYREFEEADTLPLVAGSPLPSPVGFSWEILGVHLPIKPVRPNLPSPVGFPLECGAAKSSIDVLHEEVILGRIWIQFDKQKRIHIKVVSKQPPIKGNFVFCWKRQDGEPILIKANKSLNTSEIK
ncbi:hypothetical protein M9H77_23245 [Catharanthus roseus]|uniref:Uncharacterized protein n=1 Tax=Catharanthus roseus TaxID=4058 RepID=A0ACC0ATZ7_CATRO|nr:hypothetical protein M9H77_23245 [Catharanthus roseus]